VRATTDPQPRSAFGGGITHGHQPSGFYEKLGHPGNIFWPQALQANEIYRLLDASQRRGALVKEHMPFFQYQGEIDRTVVQPGTNWDEPRRESDIRFRAPGSGTPGLPVKEFSSEQRQALEGLLASLLEPYRAHYQNQVRDCIAQQGGLEQLTLAFYQERDMGGDEVWDNWRLEGPSFVWFFRGAPHVHLWIHVARDPQAPITSYFG
jgi:hypothetical protein